MKVQKLKRINELAVKIDAINKNIEECNWIKSENVVERSSSLRYNGGSIEVPEELFKIIGKLVLSENKFELSVLEEEFNTLLK